ncbi:MAG: SUMF1/EgtB/PvdO family nonheme iron enzyme [bacterium]|nr:SUMF1/EgtB/PvdO family nonheme iron enzyme [bacterium]
MKKISTILFLTVVFLMSFSCTGLAMRIRIEEDNKQDITKYFKKLHNNLKKIQEDEIIQNVTFVIETDKISENSAIKFLFTYTDGTKTEHIFKTNYPNDLKYDMKRISNKLEKVECFNINSNDNYSITSIYFTGYNIQFYQTGKSAFIKNIYPYHTAADLTPVRIKSFLSLNDFVLFDKKNQIFIDKARVIPPSDNYINTCLLIREIFESDYKWINKDWNLNFVLTSSKEYINEHCFPLNYIIIYIPEEGYGDNFWQPVNQIDRIHSIFHEILEANINISTQVSPIKTRFFYEGLAEYLTSEILRKIDKYAYLNNSYHLYAGMKDLKNEYIDLLKTKYMVPSWGGYAPYPASKYVWEKLKQEKNINIEKIYNDFKHENNSELFFKNDEILINILANETGMTSQEIKGILKVNVSEMLEYYAEVLGINTRYKEMEFVSVRFPFNDEIKDHHFYIDKYEVSNKDYCLFLNEIGNKEEGGRKWYQGDEIIFNETSGEWDVKQGFEIYPVMNVSYYGAMAFCNWCGKRLPTILEFQIAAGKTGLSIINLDKKIPLNEKREIVKKSTYRIFKYPWGDTWDPKKCNWDENGEYDGHQKLAPVNSFPEGQSPWGCYNMSGNVWEYVDSENIDGNIHVGGCYKYGKEFQSTDSKLFGIFKSDSYDCVGFRCVKDIDLK